MKFITFENLKDVCNRIHDVLFKHKLKIEDLEKRVTNLENRLDPYNDPWRMPFDL